MEDIIRTQNMHKTGFLQRETVTEKKWLEGKERGDKTKENLPNLKEGIRAPKQAQATLMRKQKTCA